MADRKQNQVRGKDGNRLELLLFRLGGQQRFGINVLKVKEVIPCPRLTQLPDAHHAIRGVARLRGEPLSVIDLSAAIGRRPQPCDVKGGGSVIVTEFNRVMQGFLVSGVDRIVLRDWGQVQPPPQGAAASSYMSGVSLVDDELVQILDVERVLVEVVGGDTAYASEPLVDSDTAAEISGRRVLVVDDSAMARNQTARTLDRIGVSYLMARDGREALEALKELGTEGHRASEEVMMIISDIEMPEMDGYSLVEAVRRDPALDDIYVLLHTSLNGTVNVERADAAGADAVLTKFVPEELARAVVAGLQAGPRK